MKFWAFLLAFHLCAITVEPVLVEAINHAMHHTKNCCDRSCCKNKPMSCPINCPANGTCKASFGSVGVYTVSTLFKLKLFTHTDANPIVSVDHSLISDYLADCFHPPELT
jgi:hypothetical protein